MIVRFDTVISAFPSVVERFNAKFQLKLARPDWTSVLQRQITDRIRSRNWGTNSNQLSIPHDDRVPLQSAIFRLLNRPDFAKQLSQAEEIYRQFCERGHDTEKGERSLKS
jgi:hypothetical protein